MRREIVTCAYLKWNVPYIKQSTRHVRDHGMMLLDGVIYSVLMCERQKMRLEVHFIKQT